jgi:UvrB/uvrC motif
MMDLNQLQTALNLAIASEDYAQASRLRDQIRFLLGDNDKSGLPGDWQSLAVLEWLAERAERLGYRFPTGNSQNFLSLGSMCHVIHMGLPS